MARVDWQMKGKYVKNCNCAFGCPCDFNARPTQGHCEGMAGMHIDDGYFGDVTLAGLRWVATYHWPGALHEGNGTLEQEEGTFFHILSLIVSNMLEPQFLPIDPRALISVRTSIQIGARPRTLFVRASIRIMIGVQLDL